MMRRFIISLLVLMLAVVNVCDLQAVDYLQMGKMALQKKNYSLAMQYISQSVKENRNDPERVYYLGLVLQQMGEIARAKRAYETALRLSPSTRLAGAIRSQVSSLNSASSTIQVNSSPQLRSIQKQTQGNNYIDKAMSGSTVCRWDLAKMPLKVYIAPGNNISGFISDYKTSVIRSLNAWSAASRNKIRFEVARSKDNADIVVGWTDGFVGEKVGESPYVSIEGVIIRSDVNLSTRMPNGTQMTPQELYAISLHEFGHALGIKGHSPYPEDVMYFSYNQNNYNGNLTQSDINTISMLYKLDADVTNKLPINQAQTKEFFKNQLLGDKYFIAMDYKTALNYYLAAYKVYNKEFMTNYNIAACYMNTGDVVNAAAYYKNAVMLNPNDTMANYYLAIAEINLANQMTLANQTGSVDHFKTALRHMQVVSTKNDKPADADSLVSKLQIIVSGQ